MKYFILSTLLILLISNCTAQESYQKPATQDRLEGENLGWSTSIFGNSAAAGAPHRTIKQDNDTLKAAGAVYLFNRNSQGDWLQIQRITAEDPKLFDWFGTDVSLSDEYLAVGAKGFDKLENNSDHSIREGAVFIYKKDTYGLWQYIQTITLAKAFANDQFGEELELNGNILLVSAPFYKRETEDFPNNSSGCVFIYQLGPSGKWELKDQIIPLENINRFGSSIALTNNYAIIASLSEEQVYLYSLDNNKKGIVFQQFSSPDSSVKDFASAVSINDNYLFIGAHDMEDYQFFDVSKPLTDSVFILTLLTETEDGLAYTSKLIPNIKSSLDSFNISKEQFKKEALLYETWEEREQRKGGAGAVLVYKRNVNNEWNYLQKIIASDQGADDHFGMCLKVDDSLLIVGAFGNKLGNEIPNESLYHGAAYVFQLNNEGKWIEIKKLTSTQNKSWLKFGFSVDIDENKAIIGSRFEYINENKKGGDVYFWEK